MWYNIGNVRKVTGHEIFSSSGVGRFLLGLREYAFLTAQGVGCRLTACPGTITVFIMRLKNLLPTAGKRERGYSEAEPEAVNFPRAFYKNKMFPKRRKRK